MIVVLVWVEAAQQNPRSVYFVAYLLSMVLGQIWLLQGLQNAETMLRIFEALGGWCATVQHMRQPIRCSKHGQQIMKTTKTT